MAVHEPFNVIYQTAEDGLGDTIKPRLMEAEADLDRILVIDESKQGLSLSDERIERAIRQTGARLIILDPIQAYVGEKTDMNKANEIRPMFRRLAEIAERTGCAVILIGHLNKAAGGQSAYRGLGSIDFRAAARSVLLIGRVKREPNVRVIVHDKSSLAPEGKPIAFCLDPETGFSWIGEYDITADELLSGAGGNTATKTEQAERLILDLLADGKELASEDLVKAAAEAGISVVVKHFCNTLFEKFTRHIWLQMVFSNHCMNEGGHDYTIHTHSGLVLHLSWLHHKNDWDISIHFLVYYRNAPSVRYHKDSLPYSCFDKFPYFHNN